MRESWTMPPGLPSLDVIEARASRIAVARGLAAGIEAAQAGAALARRTIAALPDLGEAVEAISRRFEHLATLRMTVTALGTLATDRVAHEAAVAHYAAAAHAGQEALAGLQGAPCPECGRPLERMLA